MLDFCDSSRDSGFFGCTPHPLGLPPQVQGNQLITLESSNQSQGGPRLKCWCAPGFGGGRGGGWFGRNGEGLVYRPDNERSEWTGQAIYAVSRYLWARRAWAGCSRWGATTWGRNAVGLGEGEGLRAIFSLRGAQGARSHHIRRRGRTSALCVLFRLARIWCSGLSASCRGLSGGGGRVRGSVGCGGVAWALVRVRGLPRRRVFRGWGGFAGCWGGITLGCWVCQQGLVWGGVQWSGRRQPLLAWVGRGRGALI